jgi:hypothetical protein
MESSPLPAPLYHFGLISRPRVDETGAPRRRRRQTNKRGETLDLLV